MTLRARKTYKRNNKYKIYLYHFREATFGDALKWCIELAEIALNDNRGDFLF